MEAKAEKNKKILYFIYLLLIFFITADLTANLINNFVFAFIFSTICAFFTFYGNYKQKTLIIENNVDKSIEFIKKNFDKWNMLLSILDVICSLIALFTGILVIGIIFRCIIIIRIIIILNKFKTVFRVVLLANFIYLFKRKDTIKRRVKTMKISKTQIVAIIIAILGIAYGIICYFMPNISIWGNQIFDLLTALGIEGMAGIIGTLKGYAEKTESELNKTKLKEKFKSEKIELRAKQEAELKSLIQSKVEEAKQVEVTEQK